MTKKDGADFEMRPLDPAKLKEDLDPMEMESKITGPLVFAVFVCAMGSSFQFGYNIGVVNTPEKVVRQWFSDSHNTSFAEEMSAGHNTMWWSFAVSAFCLGGMIGGMACGMIADKFGRKGGMVISNCIGILAAALMGLSKYANVYYMFVLGRLVVGVNSGLNSGLAPMYLTEIAPVNYRGAIGSINQLVVTISILASQILGIFMGTETLWPLLFALTAVPAIFQCIFLRFCPESPRYNLIYKKQDEEAERDLKKLRGKDDVFVEMESMRREAAAMRAVATVQFFDMFRFPLLWPLSISVMMMFSQQFSGINACMFFSSNIFRSAGLDGNRAQIATLFMGALNVFMTLISVMLVDRFGRRLLHMSGMLIMFLTSAGTVVMMTLQKSGHEWAGYVCVLMVLLFVVGFATGPGSIPWFFVSELFSQGARGHANSVAVMTNWAANFLVGLLFLPLTEMIRQYSFLVFSGCLLFFMIYTYFFVPETKGQSIDYIVKRFEDRKYFTHKGT